MLKRSNGATFQFAEDKFIYTETKDGKPVLTKEFAYTKLFKVQESKSLYVVYLNGGLGAVMLKRNLTEEQQQELVTFLKERVKHFMHYQPVTKK